MTYTTVLRKSSRMDVIHEEGDFECDTGMDVKPVQLFQCRCDVAYVVSGTESFY